MGAHLGGPQRQPVYNTRGLNSFSAMENCGFAGIERWKTPQSGSPDNRSLAERVQDGFNKLEENPCNAFSMKDTSAYAGYSERVTNDNDVLHNNSSPCDWFGKWVTGNGVPNDHFTNGDQATEDLKRHSHIEQVRDRIRGEINDGHAFRNFGSTQVPYERHAPYHLGGMQGVRNYSNDSGMNCLARDRGCDRGNLTVAYMGSYDLHYKVTSVNPGTREATVAFHAYNEFNYVFRHTSTDHRIYEVVGPQCRETARSKVQYWCMFKDHANFRLGRSNKILMKPQLKAGKFMLFLILLAASPLAGCGNADVRKDDLVGIWGNSSGAEIRLLPSGSFSFRNLPADIFREAAPKSHKLVSGDGESWKLVQDNTGQRIELQFYWIDSIKQRLLSALYIDGSAIYFDNALGIEGATGDRFYFEKQPVK